MNDTGLPVKRGGGIVCPECRRVAIIAGDISILPKITPNIWCSCEWVKDELSPERSTAVTHLWHTIYPRI